MKVLLVLLINLPLICSAQNITVTGNVIDAVRGKALKGRIVYKSYPTGSISGSVNDSTFMFQKPWYWII